MHDWAAPAEGYWRLDLGPTEYLSVKRHELDREDRRRYHWHHRSGPVESDGRPPLKAEGRAYALIQALSAAEKCLTRPLGYMVVRDEDGVIVADWDAESHATYDEASAELDECQRQEPLYEWYLVELRPAEVPW